MNKQYYAILVREKNFNDENTNFFEETYITPEIIDEESRKCTTITCCDSDYKKVYNEFKRTQLSFPEIKELAGIDSGSESDIEFEMCIARISVMNDWVTLK